MRFKNWQKYDLIYFITLFRCHIFFELRKQIFSLSLIFLSVLNRHSNFLDIGIFIFNIGISPKKLLRCNAFYLGYFNLDLAWKSLTDVFDFILCWVLFFWILYIIKSNANFGLWLYSQTRFFQSNSVL